MTGRTPSKAWLHTADLLAGKVSLVAVLNSRLSQVHVASYLSRSALLRDHAGDALLQHVQLTHVARSAFARVAWLFFRDEPPFEGHAGCTGRDGARTPPIAGANAGGAAFMGCPVPKLGVIGAMGMDGAMGAGGNEIL